MTGYNDPKHTTTKVTTPVAAKRSNRTLWTALAVIAGLLLLGWLFGLFDGNDATTTPEAAITDAPATGTGTTTGAPAAPAN